MAARDDSRRDAEYEDIERGDGGARGDAERARGTPRRRRRGDAERGDGAHGDAEHDGAARGDAGCGEAVSDHLAVDGAERDGLALGGGRNTGSPRAAYDGPAYDGPAYAGMDALMAALLDDPLPEEALRDAEFVASRDAAAADVALLREQLGLIGEALAVPDGDAVAGAPPGRPVAARPGDAAGAETDSGHVPGSAPAPVASVRPLLPRPSRARRALTITFGTLAAAAAASVVLGVGWVVVQTGGGVNETTSDSGAASDKSVEQEAGGGGDDSASLSREGYVACARLIVEGTVTEVAPETGAGQDRITVERGPLDQAATRARTGSTFPMDHDADPRLKQGDHVLVSIPRAQRASGHLDHEGGGDRPRPGLDRGGAAGLGAAGVRLTRCSRTPKGRVSTRTPAPHARIAHASRTHHATHLPAHYGVTFSIRTLPVPAAVPRALSSWTWPKNCRPSGAAPATTTFAETGVEAPVAELHRGVSSTLTEPRAAEKNTSR